MNTNTGKRKNRDAIGRRLLALLLVLVLLTPNGLSELAGTAGMVAKAAVNFQVFRVTSDGVKTLQGQNEALIIGYHNSISTISGNDCYYEIVFQGATNVAPSKNEYQKFALTKTSDTNHNIVYKIEAKAIENDESSLEAMLAPFGQENISFTVDGGSYSFDCFYKRLLPVPQGIQNLGYRENTVRTWEEAASYENNGLVGVVNEPVDDVYGVASAVDVGSYRVFLKLLYPVQTQWMYMKDYSPVSGEAEEQRHVDWNIHQDETTERSGPTGLTASPCQSVTGGDGSISGLTTEGLTNVSGIECSDNGKMEYFGPSETEPDNSSAWTAFEGPGNSVSGLKHGTYYVRYAAGGNYSRPGKYTKVVVGRFAPSGSLQVSGLENNKAVVGATLRPYLDSEADALKNHVKYEWYIPSESDTLFTTDDNSYTIKPEDLEKGSIRVRVVPKLGAGETEESIEWEFTNVSPDSRTYDIDLADAAEVDWTQLYTTHVRTHVDGTKEDGKIVFPVRPSAKAGEEPAPYYELKINEGEFVKAGATFDSTVNRYVKTISADEGPVGTFYARLGKTSHRRESDEYGPFYVYRQYEVAFDPNVTDGYSPATATGMPATQWVNATESATEPASNPLRTGFVFAGWYADKKCSGDPYDFSTSVTEPITLYARWDFPALSGNVYFEGEQRYGETVRAYVRPSVRSQLKENEVLFYTWYRGDEIVQEEKKEKLDSTAADYKEGGQFYTLTANDVGQTVTCVVTAKVLIGEEYVNRRNGSFLTGTTGTVGKAKISVKPDFTVEKVYDGSILISEADLAQFTFEIADEELKLEDGEWKIMVTAENPRYDSQYASKDSESSHDNITTRTVKVDGWTMAWKIERTDGYEPSDLYELTVDLSGIKAIINATTQSLTDYENDRAVSVARREQLYSSDILNGLTGNMGTMYLINPDPADKAIDPKKYDERTDENSDEGIYYWSYADQLFISQKEKDQRTKFQIGINPYDENGDGVFEYNERLPGTYTITTVTNGDGRQRLRFIPPSFNLTYPEIRSYEYKEGTTVYARGGETSEGEATLRVAAVRTFPTLKENQDLRETYGIHYSILGADRNNTTKAEIDPQSGLITFHDAGEFIVVATVGSIQIVDSAGDLINYTGTSAECSIRVLLGRVPESLLPIVTTPQTYTGDELTGVRGGGTEGKDYSAYYTLTGDVTATNAGTYRAYATPKLGYAWVLGGTVGETYIEPDGANERAEIPLTWVIQKAANLKDAPPVTGKDPTTDTSNDGKILWRNDDGTTRALTAAEAASMEYTATPEEESSYQTYDNGGLKPGIYYVRYRGDDNHEASKVTTVTIHVICKVIFRTEVGQIEQSTVPGKKEMTVYVVRGGLVAEEDRPQWVKDQIPLGYEFTAWKTSEGETYAVDQDPVTGNLVLIAQWEPIPYTISYEFYSYEYEYKYNSNGKPDPKNNYSEKGAENVTSLRTKLSEGEITMKTYPIRYTVASNTFTLPTPKYGDYAFVGWTCDALGDTWNDEYKWYYWDSYMERGLNSRKQTIDPSKLTKEQLGTLTLKANFLRRAETPTASPNPDAATTYNTAQEVSLATSESNASLFYTVDGTQPRETSQAYVGSISVAHSQTIRAIAVVDGRAVSKTMTAEYMIQETAKPSITGLVVEPVLLTAPAGDGTRTISARLSPDGIVDTASYSLTWESSDKSIADISRIAAVRDGSIPMTVAVGNKTGTATITVKEETSGETTTFRVKVYAKNKDKSVEPTGVKLYANSLSLRVGSTVSLGYDPVPANATDIKTKWVSSDENIVAVSQDGTITAKAETTGTPVRVSLQLYRYGDNKMSNKLAEATCEVTVSGVLSVDSIMIEPKNLTLAAPRTAEEPGGSARLMAAVYPEDAPNRSVLWNIYNSEDRKYLRIDADGTVTARYVEPTYDDNGQLIEEKYPKYVTVTATAADGAKDSEGNRISASMVVTLTKSVLSSDESYYPNTDSREIWVGAVEDQVYTGAKITPRPNVYYGQQLLTEGTDYTLTWKNNINVMAAGAQKSPQVIVKLKGSYQGTRTRDFNIVAADIREATIMTTSAFITGKDMRQKIKPRLSYAGRTLKENRDYKLTFTATAKNGKTPYVDAESWEITVEGLGNFAKKDASGVLYTVKTVGVLVDKAASVSVNLAQVKVTMLTDQSTLVYNGQAQEPQYRLTDKAGTELKSDWYRVNYLNNVNAGKAKAVFTPLTPDCYGKKEVTFTIEKRNIELLVQERDANGGKAYIRLNNGMDVVYKKNEVKPPVEVYAQLGSGQDYIGLTQGKDFTVTWQNSAKIPPMNGYAKVKGKGNYKGTWTQNYAIREQQLSNVMAVIDDFNYVAKPNAYQKTKITLWDSNGKTLKLGTDYVIKSWEPGDGSIPSIGSTVSVLLQGTGPYTGTLRGSLKVITKSMRLDAAKVSFYRRENSGAWTPYSASQFYMVYDGSPVVLTKNHIELLIKGVNVPSSQYDIIGFLNNDKAGTGRMILKGTGKYGGLKTVNFRIVKQG